MVFKKVKNQKGVSLFLALVIMTIFLSMGLGLTAILMSQREVIRGIDYSVIALGAADTGAERAIFLDVMCTDSAFCLNNQDICDYDICSGVDPGYSPFGDLDESGASFDVEVTVNCGVKSIKSTGSYQKVKRAFEIGYGVTLADIYLNSASGKTCTQICDAMYCNCTGMGVDAQANDDNYYEYGAGPCTLVWPADCSANMVDESEFCYGNAAKWTHCKCEAF